MPTIKANGVNLFYELSGPANAPVIAFSHSIGATLEMWDAQVAAFSDRYRCLRYDTRGHGRSETVDRPASEDDLADDLAGLLDGLGIARAHVVGLSLGGMTGQAFALRHPGKLDRLVLVATTAKMPVKKDWDDRADLVRREGYDSFIETVLSQRWFTPGFAARSPAVIDGFRKRFLANDRVGYAVCCSVIGNLDLVDRIDRITAPTLIIAASEDPATPVAMAETIRSKIRHAEMVVIPNAAHILVVEQPDLANAYIGAFLDRGRP